MYVKFSPRDLNFNPCPPHSKGVWWYQLLNNNNNNNNIGIILIMFVFRFF